MAIQDRIEALSREELEQLLLTALVRLTHADGSELAMLRELQARNDAVQSGLARKFGPWPREVAS